MPAPAVAVRPYKPVPLGGGTLLVSVPHGGIANILLTDYLLEHHGMDQVAALDSEAFPPFAMMHRGRARFPARIHADPRGRLAVLRCEFTPPPFLARPITAAVLDWAAEAGLDRVVALDALHVVPRDPADAAGDDPGPGAGPATPRYAGPPGSAGSAGSAGLPGLWFAASREETREAARKAGLSEFTDGVLEGVPATMLLEARFRDADVVGLFVERREALDDARGVVALARGLPGLVAGLRLDLSAMETQLDKVETAVRQARAEAEKVLRRMQAAEPGAAPPAMYG